MPFTGHLQTSVCRVASVLDGYGHPEKHGNFETGRSDAEGVEGWAQPKMKMAFAGLAVALHLVQELQPGCPCCCRLCLPISEALFSVKGNGLLISSFS